LEALGPDALARKFAGAGGRAVSFINFFRRQITVARVYGIPVRIDYRWFFIFALSVWLVSRNLQHGTSTIPANHPVMAWFLGMITTLALFLSVFGHELSHALMGRAEGIEIEEIVLHPFGGLARLRGEPENPRAEFRIAVAGPAASFLFALLGFGAMAIANMGGYRTTAAVFFFLGFGNLLLAVFNLFPGYPLDGGRVLRAFLWHRGGNISEATRIAGRCGQVIAWALISIGVFIALQRRDLFTGMWTVLIGLFLLDAASGVVGHAGNSKQRTVAEAMINPVVLAPDLLISHFVDAILPLYRQTSFPVAENESLHGILALEDLKALPRERWHRTKARDVMRPVSPSLFVQSSTTMAEASEIMKRNGTGSLAVIDSAGRLVGFLQRGITKRRKK
jgi:Zn-dependent protease/CBS domain-containing protein